MIHCTHVFMSHFHRIDMKLKCYPRDYQGMCLLRDTVVLRAIFILV